MQNYVTQLIEDLAAKTAEPALVPDYALLYPDHPAVEHGLHHIVAWEMAPYESMETVFGIAAAALPPAEMLTEEQAQQLLNAILALWESRNIMADMPFHSEGITATLMYAQARRGWGEYNIQRLAEGTLHLEFCSYEPEACAWGQHCSCKEFEFELDDEMPE